MQKVIIDGYNVIHCLPGLKERIKLGLEAARKALVSLVLSWQGSVNFKGNITIVFDSREEGLLASESSIGGIKCIFTRNKQDADTRIISLVRNNRSTGQIIVVSDDNYVYNNCKAHGAVVKPSVFLLERPKGRSAQDEKSIDSASAKDITDFYKRQLGIK